jgi:hypothetical protein
MICGPMTIYCEPFIHQVTTANCQAFNAAGFGPNALESQVEALDDIAKDRIDNQGSSGGPRLRAILAYNPFQTCNSGPVFDEAYTETLMTQAKNTLMPTNQIIMQTNNLAAEHFNNGNQCTITSTSGDSKVMAKMKALHANANVPISFQTAAFPRVIEAWDVATGSPSLAKVLHCAALVGAHQVELPNAAPNTNPPTPGYKDLMSTSDAGTANTELRNN